MMMMLQHEKLVVSQFLNHKEFQLTWKDFFGKCPLNLLLSYQYIQSYIPKIQRYSKERWYDGCRHDHLSMKRIKLRMFKSAVWFVLHMKISRYQWSGYEFEFYQKATRVFNFPQTFKMSNEMKKGRAESKWELSGLFEQKKRFTV